MARFLFILFVLLSNKSYSQTDSIASKRAYRLTDKEHFYQYCSNCNSNLDRPKMLCGHNYKAYFGGYSYTGMHWFDLGFSKDVASCFPEKGGQSFSGSIILKPDQELVSGIKLTYLRDNLFGLQFYYLKFGFNLEGYTNYKTTAVNFRPEIRIADNMDYFGLLRRIHFAYGYNYGLHGDNNLRPEKHQFSIILILRIRGWVS